MPAGSAAPPQARRPRTAAALTKAEAASQPVAPAKQRRLSGIEHEPPAFGIRA